MARPKRTLWIDRRGTVSSDGTAIWRLCWRASSERSTPTRFSLGRMTEAEARRLLGHARTDLERVGHPMPPRASETSAGASRLRVADVLDRYTDHLLGRSRAVSYKRKVLVQAEHLVRHLGDVRADAIRAHHLGDYIQARMSETREVPTGRPRKDGTRATRTLGGVSSTTARNEANILRQALRWAKDRDHLPATYHVPPATKAQELPQDQRLPRRLSEGEVRRLIDAAPGHLRELLTVLAWSGRRPVAVFALHAEDCHRLVQPGLTREQRLVFWRRDKGQRRTGWGPVTEPVLRALRARLEVVTEGPLWATTHGNPWSDQNWPPRFRRIAVASGVDNVQPYDLRKHGCAQLLRRLGDPHLCLPFTGHKTVQMFLTTYAYALPGSAEEHADSIDWTPEPLRLASGGEDDTPLHTPGGSDR